MKVRLEVSLHHALLMLNSILLTEVNNFKTRVFNLCNDTIATKRPVSQQENAFHTHFNANKCRYNKTLNVITRVYLK